MPTRVERIIIMAFRHCTIVGLGLLGGSLAFDLREKFPDMTITGIARRKETLHEAAALQHNGHPVFSQLTTDLHAAAKADLVVLCTPVQTIISHLAQLGSILQPGTVVTDVGSTKRAVMNAATMLPSGIHFIGGHPMAGSDRAGLAFARAELFRNATWAICAPEGEDDYAADVSSLVAAIGANPLPIDPATHDDLVALTSHLPHIIASALTNHVLGSAYDDAVLPFIAGGFCDTTRIAASSPAMWRDIMLTNRDRIVAAMNGLLDELTQWRDAVRSGDTSHLEALLTMAHDRRERLSSLR